MDPSESHDKRGHILAGRYEILSEIGRGGFGMVYRARQLNMDREVAIKVLPPQFMAVADVVERFKREAKLTSQLTHPNTITIHDYGQAENLLFIVMELLDGEDLADVLKRERTLPMERILHVARHILKSLSEAHQKGIVHRDLKPENIYLCPMLEGDDIIKVLDFGIAKLAQPDSSSAYNKRLTVTGSTVGTPVYMSPEQAAGEEVDPLTDLYALGIMIYEMACGMPPFHDANPVKVMRSHLFSEVPPFPPSSAHAGTHLERVVMRALQKEKTLRYQSAREFLNALDASKPTITTLPSNMLSSSGSVSTPLDAEEDLPTIELIDTSDEEDFDALLTDDPSTPLLSSLIQNTGDHLAQHTTPHSDVIPFDELLSNLESSASRERVRHGVSTSSPSRLMPPTLTEEGSGAYDLSTSSSILSIIEHAPGPSDPEEVFLLTRPKKPSHTFTHDDGLDVGEGQQAPISLGPPALSQSQSMARVEQPPPSSAHDVTPPSEGWSWDLSTTSDTRRVDSGTYPQLKQKQTIQKDASSAAPTLVTLLIILSALALIVVYLVFLAPS